jgi:hypothetical protein
VQRGLDQFGAVVEWDEAIAAGHYVRSIEAGDFCLDPSQTRTSSVLITNPAWNLAEGGRPVYTGNWKRALKTEIPCNTQRETMKTRTLATVLILICWFF